MKVRLFDKQVFNTGELEKLENRLGVKLPLDFVDFAKRNNGSLVERNIFTVCELGEFGIQEFISVDQIWNTMASTEGLNQNLIPFAIAEGGDILAFNSTHNLDVFLWSHESLFPPQKVSDSFTALLDMIEALGEEIQEYTLKPDEEVWVDPEFLKKFPPQFEVKKTRKN